MFGLFACLHLLVYFHMGVGYINEKIICPCRDIYIPIYIYTYSACTCASSAHLTVFYTPCCCLTEHMAAMCYLSHFKYILSSLRCRSTLTLRVSKTWLRRPGLGWPSSLLQLPSLPTPPSETASPQVSSAWFLGPA